MADGVKSDKLKALFQEGRSRSYQKNEIIIRAEDDPQGVYFIETGLLKIYSLTKQGDEHVTHFFGPGDFFPMIWIFRDQMRNVYYEAIEPVTVRIISKSSFLSLVNKNQDVMFELLEEMVQRYLRYAGRIDNLLYSDARERCAFRLLSLANRFGQKTPEGTVINANITHEDMAHSINMTRETFGRSLGRLQKRGVISYDDQHHLVVKDLMSLVNTIGQDESTIMWPDLMKFID
jgi:CRP/FNR family transcriptional regulator